MKKVIGVIFIGLVLLASAVFVINFRKDKTNKEYSDFHFSLYSGDKEMYGDLENVDFESNKEKIYGGIVSHHFLMKKEIANFFTKFEKQKVSTLVIIGPNHFNAGNHNILVSKYPYKTPWGEIYPNEEIINDLVNQKIAFIDEKPFEKEHSISALAGFAKYYLPNANIVPIILRRGISKEEVVRLARNLNNNLDKNSAVVASVDFSHHLNNIGAQYHDNFSSSVVESFDFDRIYNLEIDSPPSIYALLSYLKERGAGSMEYLNTNSADYYSDYEASDVTSYMFAHFKEGEIKDNKKASFLSFGDMMFARGVEEGMNLGVDVFEKIRGVEGNFFRGVDLITANLEGPITSTSVCEEKETLFKFDLSIAQYLYKNKIGVVGLANNHVVDCYEEGVRDTGKYLSENKVEYFGSSGRKYFIKETGGKKIAFAGFDYTLNSDHLEKDVEIVRELERENDLVIVNAHWGIEYRKKSSSEQQMIGHQLIDAGASVIIGHHPHVIQEVEIYNDGVIFYSLGNFIFDQAQENLRQGFGVGLIAGREQLEFYIFPYEIKKYQPELLGYDKMVEACGDILGDLEGERCYFGVGR